MWCDVLCCVVETLPLRAQAAVAVAGASAPAGAAAGSKRSSGGLVDGEHQKPSLRPADRRPETDEERELEVTIMTSAMTTMTTATMMMVVVNPSSPRR